MLPGRLDHINYFADQDALSSDTINERWSYQYDEYGRKSAAIHSLNNSGTFTPDRIEETFYDDRGRVIAESTPEGVLGYTYDSQGRMTSTAVYAAGDDPQIDDPERITFYSYDILGRLVAVQEDSTPDNTTDDPQIETDYTFDLAGRADTTTTTDSESGQSVTTDYNYDALGRLDTQTDYQVEPNQPQGVSPGSVLASYDYTVRPDGKRTSLNETHWFDADSDGTVDSGEQKTTTYDWTYDSIGRLTNEVIDHWDDDFDQTESFTYDLTGNRLQLDRDHGNDGIDQVITYDYDANDRLLEEVLDDLVNNADDTTTSYTYDHTQQTSKTVTSGIGFQPVSAQHFTFNLQGRIATVINESYTDGALSSRERTGYEYNSGSYRVSLVTHQGTTLGSLETETWNLKSETSFLADSRNHTGYTQTLRETTANADGTSKTVDYTFGHDEIAQTTIEYDSSGLPSPASRLIYGHDGHGSVRVLYDLAEAAAGLINQVATFAAYGQVIAIHAANAAVSGTTESVFKSSLGYSGEQWDTSLRMQNLRARAYDPRNGRFIGLDPFAGNMQDPQSLHKYAYVHGDPVQGIDPTGNSIVSAISVAVSTVARFASAVSSVGLGASLSVFATRALLWLFVNQWKIELGLLLAGAAFSLTEAAIDWSDKAIDKALSNKNTLIGDGIGREFEKIVGATDGDNYQTIDHRVRDTDGRTGIISLTTLGGNDDIDDDLYISRLKGTIERKGGQIATNRQITPLPGSSAPTIYPDEVGTRTLVVGIRESKGYLIRNPAFTQMLRDTQSALRNVRVVVVPIKNWVQIRPR